MPDASCERELSVAPEHEFSHWTEAAALLKLSARKGYSAPAGMMFWREYQSFRCIVASGCRSGY
jgi:hypothetical protein